MSQTASLNISPAERRRRKVRESIIEAAERVFAKEGEAGLSIRRLAEEIDYSPAAIYKYFDSKDDLIEELKSAFFELLIAENEKPEMREGDFRTRSRRCIGTYIKIALDKPHHYAAAFSGVSEKTHDSFDSFISGTKGQAFGMLMDIVREGIEEGIFRPDLDIVLASKSIWASSHGLVALMTHLPHFADFYPDERAMGTDDFVAAHVDQVLCGLERSEAEGASKNYKTTGQSGPAIRTV